MKAISITNKSNIINMITWIGIMIIMKAISSTKSKIMQAKLGTKSNGSMDKAKDKEKYKYLASNPTEAWTRTSSLL